MLDLDEALERFHVTGPEYLGGLSNHGPMASEALIVLGHGALTQGFVDVYAPRLPPLEPGRALSPEEEAGARGRIERFPDWLATIERELSAEPWTRVLARRVADQLDGLFAAATHGLLRTAHAVRGLAAAESGPRLRELAHGLAYWAARYQELPGRPGVHGSRSPATFLRNTPLVPRERRENGLLIDSVRPLDDLPAFRQAIEEIEVPPALEGALGELCVAAAEMYLRHPGHRIAYVHALTGPSALRLLAPYLAPETRAKAFGRAAQAAAALHAVSGAPESSRPPLAAIPDDVRRLAASTDEIRYRAACSLEEHAIKYAEACLREDALRPCETLRLAAADAALHLPAKTPAPC